jgi:hypothetical protein
MPRCMKTTHGASAHFVRDMWLNVWAQLEWGAKQDGDAAHLTREEWAARIAPHSNAPFIELEKEWFDRVDAWSPTLDGVEISPANYERATAMFLAAVARADVDGDEWLSPFELNAVPDFVKNAVAALEGCEASGPWFWCNT